VGFGNVARAFLRESIFGVWAKSEEVKSE